jgi:hypothetical protein
VCSSDLYGCLKFKTGETYIDYLVRIKLIQPGSHILSFPFELNDFIQDMLVSDHIGKCAIEIPNFVDYPIIISGNLDEIKKIIMGQDVCIVEGILDKLGAYFPVLNIIVMDQEKITEVSNELKWYNDSCVWPNYTAVYEIVLRHEIGHWLSHELLVNRMCFNDTTFLKLDLEIHEFWAQIIAYNLLDNDSETQRFMNLLAENQPAIYQTYKQYSNDLTNLDLRDLLIRRDEITNMVNLRTIIGEIKHS